MTGRLLRRYLRDRLWLILACYLATAVVLVLFGLLLSFHDVVPGEIAANAAYAWLLATAILVVCCGLDLARWWPAARHVEQLLAPAVGLEALANLPGGGTQEQAAFRALLAKLFALAAAERVRYEEAHGRQLTFITQWVHQMKTPVAAISLIAQEARGREAAGQPLAELRAALAGVDAETWKLADGLELVLNMARLQDFALDYHIRRVDLLHSTRSVINARKRQFIRLGIFPVVQARGAAEGDWQILTDEKWNAFVIDQIVANALKYGAQAGKPDQRLRFCLTRDGEAITLTITDQGPGIPSHDLPRVFEPFFTGENGRRFAGATGIGLYLARQVMDRLGHRIAIDSVEGEGTTVALTYPLGTPPILGSDGPGAAAANLSPL